MPDNRAELAAALLRVLEGVRLTAYQDSGGIWTIGFGRTTGVKQGDMCTMEQASLWLAEDAAPLFALVADKPAVSAAAWCSFGYNTGLHTLTLALAGTVQMSSYIHDRHGNLLPGLVARRALEAALIASVSV